MLVLSSIIFATFVAIGATLSLSYSNNNYLKAQNEEQEYTLTLDSSTPFNPSDPHNQGSVNTSLGNPIVFDFYVYSLDEGNFGKLGYGGYIANDTMISGIKTLTVTFSGPSAARLEYHWGDSSQSVVKTDFTSDVAFAFNDERPNFFRFRNTSSTPLIIEKMVITYSCDTSDTPVERLGLSFNPISGGTAYEVSASSYSLTAAIIPSEYNGKPVTAIASSAFSYRSLLTYVYIPDSITTIGSSAFSDCSSLAMPLNLPNVTSIGSSAFNRSAITGLNLGSELISLSPFNAFYGSSLTFVNIDENNPSYSSINGIVFDKAQTSIVYLPNGLVGEVFIPESIAYLDGSLFEQCNYVTSIAVDSDNENYSSLNGVLFNKDQTTLIRCPLGFDVTNYVIPNTVTTIGTSAFDHCGNIEEIYIPNSVETIEMDAFCYCTSMTSMIIPSSVTSIGHYAFHYCYSLTSINIPDSVTSLGQYCFYQCEKLATAILGSGIKDIGQNTFQNCYALTSITMSDGVRTIGNYAFDNCNKLTSIALPGALQSIGMYAFQNCSKLASISFNNTISKWETISKGSSWKSGVPATEVACTDGDVSI